MTDSRSTGGLPPKIKAHCAQMMDKAALYAETYLNRQRESGKRPKRIRLTAWRRQQRKPGPVTVINCRNLDIVL